MKTYIRNVLCLIFSTVLFVACNNTDDVEGIFTRSVWIWKGNFKVPHWKSTKFTPILTQEQAQDLMAHTGEYRISFREDGSIVGKGSFTTFTGHWRADGKERTFYCDITPATTPVGLDKLFIESLKQVQYYRGDQRYVQLFFSDKQTYLFISSAQ